MEQNKVLLSQNEIDTLLAFLLDKKDSVSADVLDQENIDKLIFLLQSNEKQKVRFDSNVPVLQPPGSYPYIILDGNENINGQEKSCVLTCEEDANHFIDIKCINQITGNTFVISPACIEKRTYVSDSMSKWGTAIPPIVFDQISSMLQVKYSKETYQFICRRFAKTLYLDESAEIPSYYMPLEESLLHNLNA